MRPSERLTYTKIEGASVSSECEIHPQVNPVLGGSEVAQPHPRRGKDIAVFQNVPSTGRRAPANHTAPSRGATSWRISACIAQLLLSR